MNKIGIYSRTHEYSSCQTDMIERIHLRILRQIVRDGSLTAAATSLHLTQSAISHAMRKLESQTGATLWQRDGRRIALTPAGDYLLGEAERLLPQLERLDSRLSDFAAGRYGTLRIGMSASFGVRLPLRTLQRMQAVVTFSQVS